MENDKLCAVSQRNSTIRAREIGHQLRLLREDAGLTQHYAGKLVGLSTASICRIEDGSKPVSAETVSALLAVYKAPPEMREPIMSIAREVNERGWWQRHNPKLGERLDTLISQEGRTNEICSYDIVFMPGILQTPEYIEALIRARRSLPETEIKARVRARMARRHILFRDNPTLLTAFIDETALHRAYGSGAVLHRQLDYLLKIMERPNIIIRVVPTARGDQVAPVDGFRMLHFPASPTVVHVENRTCDLYLETEEEIAAYDEAVHDLMQAALSTGESAELIARLMRELEEDPDVLPDFARTPVEEEQP